MQAAARLHQIIVDSQKVWVKQKKGSFYEEAEKHIQEDLLKVMLYMYSTWLLFVSLFIQY